MNIYKYIIKSINENLLIIHFFFFFFSFYKCVQNHGQNLKKAFSLNNYKLINKLSYLIHSKLFK